MGSKSEGCCRCPGIRSQDLNKDGSGDGEKELQRRKILVYVTSQLSSYYRQGKYEQEAKNDGRLLV